MKKQIFTLIIVCFALIFTACRAPNNAQNIESIPVSTSSRLDAGAIDEAFNARRNLPQVQGNGAVIRLLKDDTNGSQHQKFLLKVSDNITILIAHNIDLAPRVANIQVGDMLEFKGEYIYTPKGGTVHWTHKDPRGHHEGGWLKHNGNVYE